MEGLNLIGSQPFDTKRLKIRPFNIKDAQFMYKNWANSDNVTKYLVWNTHKSIEESIEYCNFVVKESQALDYFHWIIELNEIKEPIGSIGVSEIDKDKREAKIGYVLGEKWWNQGYMTEALEAVLAYLIFVIGFDKITIEHFTENKASGRVMQKCGLDHSGTSKCVLEQKGGREVTNEVYTITKQEWFAKNIRI
ncbi:GNAT family N-acetyltransferase [uncultured Ruminococcus sp.]|uniref:GNAT family N-acetyltransferase n=1 Tax=uncultured Ruminococcus sp. TaxID=165186 RepID=UPI0025D82374|nr:GNAT family N-acetyltransferase [uncultured Ruminococcus sp.]